MLEFICVSHHDGVRFHPTAKAGGSSRSPIIIDMIEDDEGIKFGEEKK
jgi:hypothetical protein